jgi:hypothetical protein
MVRSLPTKRLVNWANSKALLKFVFGWSARYLSYCIDRVFLYETFCLFVKEEELMR